MSMKWWLLDKETERCRLGIGTKQWSNAQSSDDDLYDDEYDEATANEDFGGLLVGLGCLSLEVGGPERGLGSHLFEIGGPSSGTFDDTEAVDRNEEHMTTDVANDEQVTTEVGDDAPSTHPESVDGGKYASHQ